MSFYVGLINDLIVGVGISRSDVLRDVREQLEGQSIPDDLIDITESTENLYNEVLWSNQNIAWIEREDGLLDLNECLCDECSHIRHRRYKSYADLPRYIDRLNHER